MIEVVAWFGSGQNRELAHIRMENLTTSTDPEYGDYSVQIAVNTGAGVAMYQRAVHNFPRKRFNVLGLMKIALDTLNEKELYLDADPDAPSTSDLARRLPRTL